MIEAIPLVFAVLLFNFFLIHSSPGDPVYVLVGDIGASQEYIDEVRRAFGLDRPLHEQLITYLSKVVQGDLGYSYFYKRSVVSLIVGRVSATAILISLALLFSSVVGVVLGVITSRKPYSFLDSAISTFSLVAYSIPTFWLGQMILLVVALRMGLFPVGGISTIGAELTGIDYILDVSYHAVLPVITLGLFYLALIVRVTRARMIEVLDQQYIVTARSKGLSERKVFYGHALRNALIPVVTVIGVNLSFLIGGAVVVETIYTWPGIGRLTFEAVLSRDFPLLLGIFIFISIVVTIITIVTDIIYAALDPRIRYR